MLSVLNNALKGFFVILFVFGFVACSSSSDGDSGSDNSTTSTTGSSETSSGSTETATSGLNGTIKQLIHAYHDPEYQSFDGLFLMEDGSIVSYMMYKRLNSIDNQFNITSYTHTTSISGITKVVGITPTLFGGNACVLTNSNDVYCWGNNENGEVGNGTYEVSPYTEITGVYGGKSYIPQKIISDVKDLVYFYQFEGYTFCALKNIGDLYCWGRNNQNIFEDNNYIFGDENLLSVNTPTKIASNVKELSMIHNGLHGWTSLAYMLDNNTIIGKSSCSLFENKLYCNNSTIDNVINVISLSGFSYTYYNKYYYLTSDNKIGVLSDNETSTFFKGNYTTLGAFGHYAGSIETGCAINTNKNLYCWGENNEKILGKGNEALASSDEPLLIDGLEKVIQFPSRKDPLTSTGPCVLQEGNKVSCWGRGSADVYTFQL